MNRFGPWVAVLAACAALALGVRDAAEILAGPPREPGWAPSLAPLAAAPLPAGARVVLVLPRSVPPGQSPPVLFEAAWQRPDLRWALSGDWPSGAGLPDAAIVFSGAPPPAGWRLTWHRGAVALYVPARP